MKLNIVLIATIFFAAAMAATVRAQAGAAPQATAAAPLAPDKRIERELAGGQSHAYQLTLIAGQYLHLVVDQRGIDVVLVLYGPDGKKLGEVDSPNGANGPEPLFWIVETTGIYKIEVRSFDKTAATGRYEARIEELRAATKDDRSRVFAQELLAEAELLRAQRTADSLRKSIGKYEESLLHRRAASDRDGEAMTLNAIGLIYDDLGEKLKALDYYAQALPLFRAVKDPGGEAITLNNIGKVYSDLGEKQKALDYYTQALPLLRAVGDPGSEGRALNNIGVVYSDLGQKQKALDYYAQALPLRRAAGDRGGEGVTLNNIGNVYSGLGEKQKALDYYTQALTQLRAVGNRTVEAITLDNIGSVYSDLGEKQKALDYFGQALPLRREAGDRGGEGRTLSNIGLAYSDLGEKQKALDYYSQALPLVRAVGDRHGEAANLNNIGLIYSDLGEKQKSLDYHQQALLLFRAIDDREGEAATLSNIGFVYAGLEEKQKALDYYAQALPLHRAIGNREGEAGTLNNIGLVYAGLGEKQKALDYYAQALPLVRAVRDRDGEAKTLNNIGKVYSDLGEKQKALDYYAQALPLFRAIGDRGGEAKALSSLAFVELNSGNLTDALTNIEAAIDILESLRTKITNAQLRSSYFATVQDYYQFYIDLLMRLHKLHPQDGYDAAALQTNERARARVLLETLAEAGADIHQGADPQLLTRERSLQQQLNVKGQLQIKLLSGSYTEQQAIAIGKEIDALTTEYQEVETEIRQKSPRYAALTQPQPLSLREIQTEVLDPDTLLLEYSLGDERSYLWAVTQDSIRSYEMPGRAEVENAVRQVYRLFTNAKQWPPQVSVVNPSGQKESQAKRGLTLNPQGATLDSAFRLSRMVLSPVAAQLGRKRLVIVADGALQFIPFVALPNPSARKKAGAYQPLIFEHEVVSLPSASTLAVLRRETKNRQPAAKELVVLADPVFDSNDDRLRSKGSATPPLNNGPAEARGIGLAQEQLLKAAKDSEVVLNGLSIPRLPGTRREADAIIQLAPASESKKALDFEASRQTATSEELRRYRYVHFATHGFLDSQRPELSGIVLSMVDEHGRPQDGFLRAHEIFNLKLPAELVVLSACETGLGQEVKGEGLIGLARGFMYAGAPRVVVSLWSINDTATAELITRFYKGILAEKMRPAQALQAAQVSVSKEKGYSAPFFWAAFTLQGEWK